MVLMQNGDQIAGGGLPVIHITQQQYDANPSAYNDPNVLVHITNATNSHLQGSDVAYDANQSMGDIGNIATKSLGKVEYQSNNVALYAHAVGEYFINKNGEYCKCTSAISVGQTLTAGTNYTVTDIASEIKGINTNLSAEFDDGKVHFFKDYQQYGTDVTASIITTVCDKLLSITPSNDEKFGFIYVRFGGDYFGTYLCYNGQGGYASIDVHSYGQNAKLHFGISGGTPFLD